jgi:hypothetical protein
MTDIDASATAARLTHPWLTGVVLPVSGGTHTVSTTHELVLTNSNVVGTVSWTVNLLSGASLVDGSYLFISDWDGLGGVTLVADKPMNVPRSGTSTTLTIRAGVMVGLVYVAAASMWLPVSYYDPNP